MEEHMQKLLNNTYSVALYCRLSRDDKDGNHESMSIVNQRQLLTAYTNEKRWRIYDIYVDDGYSGTNFERPDFKRMIRDVEDGKINCIITKDLSRLGRNYIQTGYYTDDYFVEKEVRFIAVNDSIDTMEDNNDIAAFHHVLNELYPKQVSKKIRQVKTATAKQGKFIGSQAPYGYMKSPEDKHQLIIDEEAAIIVRDIFNSFASGNTTRSIAETYNDEGLDSPRFYHYRKAKKTNPLKREKNYWNSSTLTQLMKNQVYIGNMVQGKRQVVSFKTKKRRCIQPEDWIVIENTHEPIIDQDVWERVQSRFKNRGYSEQRVNRTGELSLLSGILHCSDCGTKMAFSDRQLKSGFSGIYKCQKYVSNGRMACTSHFIKEDVLKAFILNDIKHHAKLAVDDREQIAKKLSKAMNQQEDNLMKQMKKSQQSNTHRLDVIHGTIKKLYEDKCSGVLPEEVFRDMLMDYTQEQQELTNKQERLMIEIAEFQSRERDITDWLDLISQYMQLEDLDRATVMELIECITVGEGESENGERRLEISIRYRFIGNLLEQKKKDIA